MKKILRIILVTFTIAALATTSLYSLKYMHWSTKSQGYPGLYNQTKSYSFMPVNDFLLQAEWKSLATDVSSDGDIPNWPDAKELFAYNTGDTVWIAVRLHNNLDLNDPMVSLAIEDDQGRDWYGTVEDFKYGGMISAGYYRKGEEYFGYNFIVDAEGICTLRYDLKTNSLYLGLPAVKIEPYRGKKFVVSVGQKSYWNDDFEEPIAFDILFP